MSARCTMDFPSSPRAFFPSPQPPCDTKRQSQDQSIFLQNVTFRAIHKRLNLECRNLGTLSQYCMAKFYIFLYSKTKRKNFHLLCLEIAEQVPKNIWRVWGYFGKEVFFSSFIFLLSCNYMIFSENEEEATYSYNLSSCGIFIKFYETRQNVTSCGRFIK